MELIKDERTIEIKGNTIEITRTLVESCDAEEYLRTISSVERQIEHLKNGQEDHQKVVDDFKVHQEEVQKIRDAEIEAVKKEIEDANTNSKD